MSSVRGTPGRRGDAPGVSLLTPHAWAAVARSLHFSGRELEITRAVFNNQTDGGIARQLGISPHTVHVHLNRLFEKLRVTTRTQLVLRVVQEFLALTRAGADGLPPLCRSHVDGRCLWPEGHDVRKPTRQHPEV